MVRPSCWGKGAVSHVLLRPAVPATALRLKAATASAAGRWNLSGSQTPRSVQRRSLQRGAQSLPSQPGPAVRCPRPTSIRREPSSMAKAMPFTATVPHMSWETFCALLADGGQPGPCHLPGAGGGGGGMVTAVARMRFPGPRLVITDDQRQLYNAWASYGITPDK